METNNKPMESIIDLIWTPEEDESLVEAHQLTQPPSMVANCSGNPSRPPTGFPPTLRIC